MFHKWKSIYMSRWINEWMNEMWNLITVNKVLCWIINVRVIVSSHLCSFFEAKHVTDVQQRMSQHSRAVFLSLFDDKYYLGIY